jgi:hypothetical protein
LVLKCGSGYAPAFLFKGKYIMGAIERLIQQKQFKNEHEKAIVGLLYSANFVT